MIMIKHFVVHPIERLIPSFYFVSCKLYFFHIYVAFLINVYERRKNRLRNYISFKPIKQTNEQRSYEVQKPRDHSHTTPYLVRNHVIRKGNTRR